MTAQSAPSAFKNRIAPRTLKAQLPAYGILSTLLAAAVTAAFGVRFAETEVRQRVEAQMLDTATALATALQGQGPRQAQAALTAFSQATGAEADYRVEVVDTETRILAATNPEYVGRPIAEALGHPEPELQQVLAGEAPVAFEEMTHAGVPVLDVSLPLRGEPTDPARITGALHLAVPHRAVASMTRHLLIVFGLAALLLALLLIIPLWFYLERSILRPTQIMIAANRAVAQGRPEGRSIPVELMPSHELGDLMQTHNTMLARLDQADEELRRRLRELSALGSTAALLSESLSLDELLGRTLDKVLEITGRDAGAVSLLDPAMDRVVIRGHRGFSPGWLVEEADRPVACLCAQVIRRREPLCVADITLDPGVTRAACVRQGFRSFCAIPLQAEGQILGVLSLHGRQALEPSEKYRDLLTTIANQIAIALVNVRLYEETRRLATIDSLTGLYNRRHFIELAGRELERALRYGRPLAAMMLDIDRFKRVNDTHGHAVGDQVLRVVARRCRANLREIDLVGRYGGEEFAALLPENDLNSARIAAERLRRCTAEVPIDTAGGPVSVTLSLGVAACTENCPDLENLIGRADQALYAAKIAGRNRVCIA